MVLNLRSRVLPLAAIALLTAGTNTLAAESSSPLLNDPFNISLGTFLLDTRTEVSLDGSAGTPGSEVDLGRDLGLKDSDRFRVDATWRFAQRHKVRALYFTTSQASTKTLDTSITIRDTVYPVAGEIEATNSTRIFELAYEYVFLRGDNYEISASAGVHALKFEFSIEGEGSVGGQTSEVRKESAVAQAPLPVIGLRSLWEISPQWYVDGQIQYFSLDFDAYSGSVTDLRIGLTRMFGEHFGLGAGWNTFITKVGVDKDRFDGELNWRYSGVQVFVTASF